MLPVNRRVFVLRIVSDDIVLVWVAASGPDCSDLAWPGKLGLFPSSFLRGEDIDAES